MNNMQRVGVTGHKEDIRLLRSLFEEQRKFSVQARFYSSVLKQAVLPVSDTRDKTYSLGSVSS
jgi:hypothetical protein